MLRKLILLGCLVCLVAARHGRSDGRDRERDHDRSGNDEKAHRQHESNIIIQNQGKIVNNDRAERARFGGSSRILQDARGKAGRKLDTTASQMARDNNFLLQKLGYTQVLPKDSTDMDTLLKEKFLLDVLRNINGELQDQNVIEMGAHLAVEKENFNGELDGNIAYVLQLLADGKMLDKTSQFNMFNSDHLRQTHGLYRLMLQAKDWKIFQRVVSFARQHFNGELVANALITAVRERGDTNMLVIPSIVEILPELVRGKEMNRQRENSLMDRSSGKDGAVSLGIENGMGIKKTWQEWKQEKLQNQDPEKKYADKSRQIKIKEQTLMPIDEVDITTTYFTRDLDLNNFWYLSVMKNWVEMGARLEQEHRATRKDGSIQIEAHKLDDQPSLLFVGRRRQGTVNGIEETVLPKKTSIASGSNLKDSVELELSGKKRVLNMPLEELLNQLKNDRILRVGRRRENVMDNKELSTVELGQQQIREALLTKHSSLDSSMDENIPKLGERKADIPKSAEGFFEESATMGSDSVQQKLLFVGRRRKNLNTAQKLGGIVSEPEIRENGAKTAAVGAEALIRVGRRRTKLAEGTNLNEKPDVTESIDDKLKNGLKWLKEFLSDKSVEQNDRSIGNTRQHPNLREKAERSEEELSSTQDSRSLRDTLQRAMEDTGLLKKHKSDSLNENPDHQDVGLIRVGRRRQNLVNRVDISTEEPLREQIITTKTSQAIDEAAQGRLPEILGLFYKGLQQEKEDKRRQNLEARVGLSREKQVQDKPSPRDANIFRNAFQGVENVLQGGSQEDMLDSNISLREKGLNSQNLSSKRRRFPRSLQTGGTQKCQLREGEVFLHNIQQMLARIIIEKATMKQDLLKNTQSSHNFEQLLNSLVAAELQILRQNQKVALEPENVRNIIGEILMGRIRHTDLSIYDVWSEIVALQSGQDNIDKTFLSLRNPLTPIMMQAILKVADSQSSNKMSDPLLAGVTVDDVKVDKLVTFLDETGAEHIQTRLNHKNFNIKISLTAEEAQNVLIRIFLGPKPMDRQHLILLDAFETTLKAGRTTAKRLSQDIAWTNKQATTNTQLYRDVMQAIAGKGTLQLNDLLPQNCLFPHRLLLPRGSTQGLPMQLLVVVTPQDIGGVTSVQSLKHCRVCSLGMSAANLANVGLPNITDDKDDLSVPYVMLKDVLIYHVE